MQIGGGILEFILLIVFLIFFSIGGLLLGFYMFGFGKAKLADKEITLTPHSGPLQYWTENGRGYANVDHYPPCMDISTPAKKMFALMTALGKVGKYKQFFDILSMMCCQEQELKKNDCTRVKARLNELLSLGADPLNRRASLTAAAYTTLQNNDNSNFVIAAVSLIEKHMDILYNDISITKIDKEAMRGFVYVFYETHLETINKLFCKQ